MQIPNIVFVFIVIQRLTHATEVTEMADQNTVTASSENMTTTEITTMEPVDNGMTVGVMEEDKEQTTMSVDTPSPPTTTEIPSNHKNFTASTYLGGILEAPPTHHYNQYQQQYKEYYRQKSEYMKAPVALQPSAATGRKPLKFEANSHHNKYTTNGLGSYAVTELGEEHTRKHPLFRNKFPLEDSKRPLFEAKHPNHVRFEGKQPYQYKAQQTSNHVTTDSGKQQQPHVYDSIQHVQQQSYLRPTGYTELQQAVDAASGYEPIPTASEVFDNQEVLDDTQNLNHNHLPLYHHVPDYRHTKVSAHSGHAWKKVINVLATLVPFGILLASLTPNILVINSTTPNLPSRQRSLEDEEEESDPLIKLVETYGLESLENPDCEDKLFCEMARMGQDENSNFVQRSFWILAHQTPDKDADQLGMREIFKAIRTNECGLFKCTPKTVQPEETVQVYEKKDKRKKYEKKKE